MSGASRGYGNAAGVIANWDVGLRKIPLEANVLMGDGVSE
jgi:hypothetical protein